MRQRMFLIFSAYLLCLRRVASIRIGFLLSTTDLLWHVHRVHWIHGYLSVPHCFHVHTAPNWNLSFAFLQVLLQENANRRKRTMLATRISNMFGQNYREMIISLDLGMFLVILRDHF